MNVAFRQMNTPAPTENQKGPSLKFKRDLSLYDRMKRASTARLKQVLEKYEEILKPLQ